MVSKTSLLPLVRTFDWKAVAASLDERPDLVDHRDERGRTWLHICCLTRLGARDAKDSIRTADALLKRGLGLDDAAFAEGKTWRATPVWHVIAHGQNLKLAEHLLRLGASPQFSLYAASYNRDIKALELLVKYGADIEEASGPGQTPFLGAIGWSHFEAADALARLGANVNAQDDKGQTGFHMMLKKAADYEPFARLAAHGVRVDLPDRQGRTAADLMSRKKDPRFRELAARLAS